MASRRRPPRQIVQETEASEEAIAEYKRRKKEEENQRKLRQYLYGKAKQLALTYEPKQKHPSMPNKRTIPLTYEPGYYKHHKHKENQLALKYEPKSNEPKQEPTKKEDKPKSKMEMYDELIKKRAQLNYNDKDYEEKKRQLNTQINKLLDEMDEERNAKPKEKDDDEHMPYYRWYRYFGGHQKDFANAEKRYRDWRRKEIEYYRDKNGDEWRKMHGYPRKRRWRR